MQKSILAELRTAVPTGKATSTTPPGTLAGAPHRRWRTVVILFAVAVLAFGGFLAWSYLLSPLTVSVATVQANVRQEVFGLGTISARVQSKVGFKVAGVLVALKADQGDRVRAGQVLAQLDARDINAQLALAKAGVAQARANIEKAKADVASASASLDNAKAISARRTSLAKSGITSQEEAQTNEAAVRIAAATLASARGNVAVAEAALQSAEAQEAFQEATLSNYTLYVPYDAWIVSRNLELGSMPNPGQAVFNLVAAHTVWVLAYVDERLAGPLRVGQPAKIILRSNPKAPIAGHIERIEIQSDAVNEERLVNIAFDNRPDDVHLAEQVEVVITTGQLSSAVAVPPLAVSDLRDGHGTLWTVENGHLERRQVTFERELLDGRLPIIDGLPLGAAVVAVPVSGLRIGRAAHVVETTTP